MNAGTERTIVHRPEENRFYLTEEGTTAYVQYQVSGASFVVTHTLVPNAIGGRGIAALLVSAAYSYADAQSLQRAATCTYAQVWLKRNPTSQP